MCTSLLIHDRIQTTDEKAKELRHYAEKMVTLAKKANVVQEAQPARALHYRRQALQMVRLPGIDHTSKDERAGRKALLDKLFVELAGRFAERPGGYTRVLKVGNRKGDGAAVSIIEFVGELEGGVEKRKVKPKKKAAKTETKAAAPKKEEAVEPEEETVTEQAAEPEVEEQVETPEAEAEEEEKEE